MCVYEVYLVLGPPQKQGWGQTKTTRKTAKIEGEAIVLNANCRDHFVLVRETERMKSGGVLWSVFHFTTKLRVKVCTNV
jgi:hypothetical protein